MLFMLMVSEPYLPPGFTHDATDWEIASDSDFTNIVWSSYNDSDKLIKLVDLDLNTEQTYYARARYIFNKYVAEWSDIDILEIKDKTELLEYFDLPSIVTVPRVSIDKDVNNCPNCMFSISGSTFNTTSNAKHLSTTYFIRNAVTGEVPFFISEDSSNLTSINVLKPLKPGYTYGIHMAYKSTSNDVSDPGVLYVYVPDDAYIKPINENNVSEGFGYYGTPGTDLTVSLEDIENLDSLEIIVYEVNDGDSRVVYETTSNSETFIIPGTVLSSEVDYWVLYIKAKLIDGTESIGKYLPITKVTTTEV